MVRIRLPKAAVGGETPRILPWAYGGRLRSNTDPGADPESQAWFWRWLGFRVVMGKLT